MFSAKVKADICKPWDGGSGHLLCLGDRYKWSFIQLLRQWRRSVMSIYISPLFTNKDEVWWIWYLFSFTELKTVLDLSYNIRHPSELPVDCSWMFLIAISWEVWLSKNDLVFFLFYFFYQLFHWRRSWTMRFWRRVMCVSGSRLWSCPPLSTIGSSSTIKPSRVLRYSQTLHCFKITQKTYNSIFPKKLLF